MFLLVRRVGVCDPIPTDDQSVTPLFGATDPQASRMTGVLYDLKQTADKHSTKYTSYDYHGALLEFVSNNWKKDLLNKFYKASKPIFATQIYVPAVSSDVVLSRCGATDEMSPKEWVIYFSITVIPDRDGQFQFYGRSDDILLARVQGETVLDGSLDPVAPAGTNMGTMKCHLRDTTPEMHLHNTSLAQGKPFSVTAGVPITIEILAGEERGSWFDAFLFLGKVGTDFNKWTLDIPVFQVTPSAIPTTGARLDAGPPFVWPIQ